MLYFFDQKFSKYLRRRGSILLAILFSFTDISHAHLGNYETAWLKSTAGTGVASMLVDEATFLNPAPLAFFKMSSFYFEKSKSDITPSDEASPLEPYESGIKTFIISDSKSRLKGSLSYQKLEDNFDTRKTIGFSMSKPFPGNYSIGLSYRIVEEESLQNGVATKSKYKPITLGLTHPVNESFSFGLVAIDLTQENPEDSIRILGLQYVYAGFISLMLDAGADYNRELGDTFLYRSAIQLRVFSDLFLRFGIFKDNGKGEQGNGAGLGWVTLRFVINAALKSYTIEANPDLSRKGEEIKETTFSLSYHF